LANTPRMNWPVPTGRQRPWATLFERLVGLIDGSAYARREDVNTLIMEGGDVSWSAGTGVLNWDASIVLLSPHTGFSMTIPSPTPGTFVLADGWVFYVRLTRALGSNISVDPQRAASLPLSDDVILIAQRKGTKLYFRNGRGFNDGESGAIYIATSGGGAISGFSRIQATVVTNGDTWVGSGAPATAATQGGLGAGFTSAILAPGSVDVYYNNALSHYTAGAPASVNEWRWVASGSPNPVVEIGAGSLAGDIVTVRFAN
jgi:hypothetical protein